MNDQEKADLISKLTEIVIKAVPKAHAVSKYGGTLYTLKPDDKEGQFCGLFSYADHVQLAFSQGAMLKDPDNLLQGKGKLRRHINFENAQEINKAALNRMLKEAVKVQT